MLGVTQEASMILENFLEGFSSTFVRDIVYIKLSLTII